jgi:hypothetical protein
VKKNYIVIKSLTDAVQPFTLFRLRQKEFTNVLNFVYNVILKRFIYDECHKSNQQKGGIKVANTKHYYSVFYGSEVVGPTQIKFNFDTVVELFVGASRVTEVQKDQIRIDYPDGTLRYISRI